jgi:amino acid adenylation domain-containing protein
MSFSPIFQAAFVFQNFQIEDISLPDIEIKPIDFSSNVSKYDLTLYLQMRDNQLYGTFEYNTDLFEKETIDSFRHHFINVLHNMVSNPKGKLSNISLLSENEAQKILYDWNTSEQYELNEKNVAERFNDIAVSYSNKTAITFSEYEGNSFFTDELSYRELNEKSNQLARYLKNRGLKSEELVGIATRRSLDLIISILGILKAGGAFVPIDPNYPNERIDYMISDSNMNYLISQEQVVPRLNNFSGDLILIDSDRDMIFKGETANHDLVIHPDNLAYVIYTSGSSGKPKGTLLSHKGLINLANSQRQKFNINGESKILQFSSLSFDAFVWETVMAILNGGSLNLASQDIISSGEGLARIMKLLDISTVTLPPSVLSVIPEKYSAELENLKTVIVAGEKCAPELVNKWSAKRQFVNAYGPTETTVCASMYSCNGIYELSPPIGKAIDNFKLFVLDKNMNPVPSGIPGELYIAGAGLARGYNKRPDLTADKFIPNPFSGVKGSRLYKSGDLVKYIPSGDIEFIGRVDNQIKIRGFRIELGEIEAVISNYPAVKDTIVTAREDIPEQKQIVAYIIPKNNIIEISELKSFLRRELPEYMIPVAYVFLDKFPLSPSKKINLKALPPPSLKNIGIQTEYIEPKSETENILAIIGKELLVIDRMGINDNFFELGGHSLLATQFISRIKTALKKEISLKELFMNPTISQLSKILEDIDVIEDMDNLSIEGKKRTESDLFDLVSEVNSLSDEEAQALLDEEMNTED